MNVPFAIVGASTVSALAVAGAALACAPGDSPRAGAALRINGSTTVNPVVAEAAEALREERGLSILVDTQGGSAGGIAMLGEGRIEIGTSSRALSPADRERFPGVDFREHEIGADAVALVVAADVWEAGVRSLSRETMRAIYEGRITSWMDLGGPDRPIVFFDKEPGRGTWEVFARWLYAEQEVPPVSFPQVGGNEETRNKVASTRGALSQLSCAWADGETVFALALEEEEGAVEPTPATIASGAYPMSRPLLLLTDGAPDGEVRVFIDFVRSPRGQAIVRRHGYLPVPEHAP